MKRRLVTMMAAAMFALAAGQLSAQDPSVCPNCPNGGVPKRDGTGKQAKKGQKKGTPGMQGKQTGPRDGTGPIHTPPNGGGHRGGRRS